MQSLILQIYQLSEKITISFKTKLLLIYLVNLNVLIWINRGIGKRNQMYRVDSEMNEFLNKINNGSFEDRIHWWATSLKQRINEMRSHSRIKYSYNLPYLNSSSRNELNSFDSNLKIHAILSNFKLQSLFIFK